MNSVSVYKAPVSNTTPLKSFTLAEIATVIKSAKYKTVTEKLRALPSKDERDLVKINDLDYTTLSGTFSKRANSALIQHSNRFCIDLDHTGNSEAIEAVKQRILSIYTPALMFVSPSGDGLKVVLAIDITQGSHLEYFYAFQSFFRSEFNIEIDEKCKDVSRACFLCYDPDCFTSETPDILGRAFIDTFTTAQPQKGNQKPITDQSVIIANLTTWMNKSQSFTDGNRNKYVSELCGAFNRAGITEGEALGNLLQYAEPGFPESGIRATVRSIFNNVALHGIAPLAASTGQGIKPQSTKEPELEESTPIMPINGFPDFIQQLINECSRIYGTHRDLWCAAFLSATSAALGQSMMLKTKYENSPLFWIATVGSSGVGKSEPGDFAYRPIHKIDYLAFDEHKKLSAQYKIDCKNAKKGEKFDEPLPCKQMVLVDTTPEAMATALSANPRGVTILRDELHGWLKDIGKYAQSGELQNMLSGWSQQTFKVNRKSGDNLFIKEPFINVFGGIQPGVLPEMAKDNRSDNGFLPRFCFVFPDRIEAPKYTDEEIDSDYRSQYSEYINNLLSIQSYRDEVRLNTEASKLYESFYNKNANLNNSGKQADYMNEVNSKLNIIVLRTALLFHMSQFACTGACESFISGETMRAAIELTEYFRITAKKVYKLVSNQGSETKDLIRQLSALGNSQNEIAHVLKCSQQNVCKALKRMEVQKKLDK